jgi:phage terminase large subunit-like protein
VLSYVAEPKRPKYAHLDPIVFEDDFGDKFEYVDYPAIAADWAKKVLTGEYPGCRYVKYAAKRYLRMLDMAETGKYGFVFSEAHAVDVCAFAELLPLFEDNFRDIEFTELEPWQIFVLCALYGFRDAQYGFRYVSECYLEVPRKNAKSVLATVIGLYDVRNERSRNPLILIAASTVAQAGRVFDPMRGIIDGSDGMTPTLRAATKEFREAYRLEATDDEIRCGTTGGTIQKVASIGKRQDGWNPTTVILEELHAQNPDVFAVLKSAMGSRGGQLLFQITTAGRDSFGLAWDNRKAAIAVLEGHHEDLESLKQFAIIFTLDREDLLDELGNKRTDHLYQIDAEQLWLKACPNLGVSFAMPSFHMLAAGARRKPQEREEFLRTRLNIWTNAASAIIDIEQFRRGARPDFKLEGFRGQRCWIGVDLSASEDLSAVAIVFEMPSGEIVTFCKFYMSGDSQLLKDDDYVAMVRAWIDSGLISSTREGAVDFRLIEADLRDLCTWFDVQAIGFDPAMAGQMMQNLEDDRLPVVKYVNRPHMMTAAVDDIIARAHTESASSYLYADNPVFEWCAANAQGERKKDGTILPFKDSVDSLNKIDGFVAGSMANGLRINPEFSTKIKKPSIYEKRGLLGAPDVRNGNEQGADRPS